MLPFDVALRLADGRRRMMSEPAMSRFIAARMVEQIATHDGSEENAPGPSAGGVVVESVSLRLSGRLLDVAPDETQGAADHYVTVCDRDGQRQVVHVAAASRGEAIAGALSASRPGMRVVAVTVRWPVVGKCTAADCNVPLFSDLKMQRNGSGWKCLDCPLSRAHLVSGHDL